MSVNLGQQDIVGRDTGSLVTLPPWLSTAAERIGGQHDRGSGAGTHLTSPRRSTMLAGPQEVIKHKDISVEQRSGR